MTTDPQTQSTLVRCPGCGQVFDSFLEDMVPQLFGPPYCLPCYRRLTTAEGKEKQRSCL